MPTLTPKLSDWFRRRRDARVKALIAAAPRRGETLRVLDVGGSAAYWRRLGVDFLRAQRVHVDLLNLTDEELRREADVDGLFSYIVGDACATGLPDMAYDLVHSNSVIEHVGLWPEMKRFAAEVRRLGPGYYVQTPNYWFPIDPHTVGLPFMHWLPQPLRVWLFLHFPLAWSGRSRDLDDAYRAAEDSFLLSGTQMRALFPDARHEVERLLFLPKSHIAIRSAAIPA